MVLRWPQTLAERRIRVIPVDSEISNTYSQLHVEDKL